MHESRSVGRLSPLRASRTRSGACGLVAATATWQRRRSRVRETISPAPACPHVREPRGWMQAQFPALGDRRGAAHRPAGGRPVLGQPKLSVEDGRLPYRRLGHVSPIRPAYRDLAEVLALAGLRISEALALEPSRMEGWAFLFAARGPAWEQARDTRGLQRSLRRRGGLWSCCWFGWSGEESAAVDDGVCDVGELAVAVAGVCAEEVEGCAFVEVVAFHEDAFGALDQCAACECAFEVLKLGEAAQDDVEGALQLLGFAVGDVGEDAAFGGFVDEVAVVGLEDRDHRAGCLADDLVDQVERVLAALAQADQRHVRPLTGGERGHICDVD